MNRTSMTKDEDLDMLRRAIIANLDARIERDIRRKEATARRMRDRGYLEPLISDPGLGALRRQLRDLGWRLFRLLGTTDAMLSVAQKAADAQPDRYGRRINIIDKAWDGIGEENEYWVA